MVFALLLPWFPILIAVAVASRLLGPAKGLIVGGLSAIFWVALSQASLGAAMWHQPWTMATVVAGVVAIVAVGRWAGETQSMFRMSWRENETSGRCVETVKAGDETPEELHAIDGMLEAFDEWLATNRESPDPWPAFGELVRSMIFRGCRGTHVRTLRLTGDGNELTPLHETDGAACGERLSARDGLYGHVVTSGRSFLAGGDRNTGHIAELAATFEGELAWCFPVRQGSRRLGIVSVGRLESVEGDGEAMRRTVERLVSRFWATLVDVCRTRDAESVDAVSGVNTRLAFLRAGERAVADSYRQGEPVAVSVFALEGLRQINDSGRWMLGDELLREVAEILRRKVRLDDGVGRFDGSRFVLLLRRVDSALASLIVSQVMTRLRVVVCNESRWTARVGVRCGLVGSGTSQPSLHELVSRALVQCRRAREENIDTASDIEATLVMVGDPK